MFQLSSLVKLATKIKKLKTLKKLIFLKEETRRASTLKTAKGARVSAINQRSQKTILK